MTVAVTRKELGAGELRREAGRCRDARAARRMLAGPSFTFTILRHPGAGAGGGLAGGGGAGGRHGPADAPGLGAPLQRGGPPGLHDRRRPGPRPRSPGQEAELEAVVERGPDPDRDGVVRWRRVDLKALIEARFAVRLHERSVGKVLRRLGFSRVSVRPRHPKADEAAQEAFEEGFAELVREALPEHARGKPVEVRFLDEARVGRQGTLTRVWARRGTRPRAPRPSPHVGLPVRRGLPRARRRRRPGPALRRHRGHRPAPRRGRPRGRARGARGGRARPRRLARRRRPRRAREPHPAAAPVLLAELNPVENVWEYLRQNKPSHRVWESYDAIVATCCEAWNWLVAAPDRLASITRREWTKAVTDSGPLV